MARFRGAVTFDLRCIIPWIGFSGFLLLSTILKGQDDLHWTQQIRHVPKYLGPNAIPPQEMHDAVEDSLVWFRMMAQTHQNPGDKTYNVATTLQMPLFDPRVTLRLHMVAFEYFTLSPATVNERNQFDRSTTGTNIADLNVATIVTVMQENNKRPSIRVLANIRTASGPNMDQARVIDTPGYSFVIATGKTWKSNLVGAESLRLYTNTGLRIYQARRPDPAQNDLFVYGLGLDINWRKIRLTHRLTGYVGYFEQGGDRPFVYRTRLSTLRNKNFNYAIEFGQGNSDYPYTSFSFMTIFSF